MKKLLILIAMLGISFGAVAQQTASVTITGGAGTYLISTNRLKVYSIESSTTNAMTFKLWDNDNTTNVPTSADTGFWGTNFVNGAYISRSSYLTNIATSYVNPLGYTNWYTNSGLWTVTTTNAATTNAMNPMLTVSHGAAETRVTYADLIFTRGAIVTTTGNGTITLYYRQEN